MKKVELVPKELMELKANLVHKVQLEKKDKKVPQLQLEVMVILELLLLMVMVL